ncbi:hypothetical protein ACGFX4_29955 [Kitasatospora sp. NPDC048365]|uniref:hypothetical protein n=1 Tax=Kitasatospora sp. NPDC048365 TaxID=3364050 RepID=UPI0037114188
MYYLRLARGYRTLDLARWTLTTAAAAVVAAFLLRALGRALSEPAGASLPRLLWCLPPLAAVAWFAAVAARAVPAQQPERITGLTAAGAGPRRIRLLVGGEIAAACTLGGAATLLVFLILRNDIAGPELAADLGMGVPLPAAAPVVLLAALPLVAGVSAACAIRFPDGLPGRPAEPAADYDFAPLRLALPIGLTLVGLALELYGLRPGAAVDGKPIDLPAGLGATSAAVLIGWALAATGIALLTAPLLAVAGRLLPLGRPAPLRLLAGRGLTAQARGLGSPLAVLALAVALVLTAARHWTGTPGTAEPLPVIEGVLIIGCAGAAVVARVLELRAARRPVTDDLLRLGTPPGLLAGAATLRTVAAGTVLLITGGATAILAAYALG